MGVFPEEAARFSEDNMGLDSNQKRDRKSLGGTFFSQDLEMDSHFISCPPLAQASPAGMLQMPLGAGMVMPQAFPDSGRMESWQNDNSYYLPQRELLDRACCSSSVVQHDALLGRNEPLWPSNSLGRSQIMSGPDFFVGASSGFAARDRIGIPYQEGARESNPELVESTCFFQDTSPSSLAGTSHLVDYTFREEVPLKNFQSVGEKNKPKRREGTDYKKAIYRDAIIFEFGYVEDQLGFDIRNYSISIGCYDYRFSQLNSLNGFEVGDDWVLVSADDQLAFLDPYLTPVNLTRPSSPSVKEFSKNLRAEVNERMKVKFFLDFVKLSLSILCENNSEPGYCHWKRLFLDELRNISEPLKEKLLKKIDVSTSKTYRSIDNVVENLSKVTMREVVSYALFSIPIVDRGKKETIMVSKIGLSCFLNKYSDFFIRKLLSVNLSDYPTGTYNIHRWMCRSEKLLNEVKSRSTDSIKALVRSDYKNIADVVLVFDGFYFRKLKVGELNGLMNFLEKLAVSDEGSGIIHRSVRHFHRSIVDRSGDLHVLMQIRRKSDTAR